MWSCSWGMSVCRSFCMLPHAVAPTTLQHIKCICMPMFNNIFTHTCIQCAYSVHTSTTDLQTKIMDTAVHTHTLCTVHRIFINSWSYPPCSPFVLGIKWHAGTQGLSVDQHHPDKADGKAIRFILTHCWRFAFTRPEVRVKRWSFKIKAFSVYSKIGGTWHIGLANLSADCSLLPSANFL